MEDSPIHLSTPELFDLTYGELRSLARKMMAGEKAGQTLQATALVHEAYVRLSGERSKPWANDRHFFSTAAEAMRRILIDGARRKQSARHGGGMRRTEFGEDDLLPSAGPDAVIRVSSALDDFAAVDSEKAELVKLLYFGGLTMVQAADLMGYSEATAKRHWRYARAWLKDRIAADDP